MAQLVCFGRRLEANVAELLDRFVQGWFRSYTDAPEPTVSDLTRAITPQRHNTNMAPTYSYLNGR